MSPDGQTFPLVTAAVVCYNHAQFVVEALESIKDQAYPNLHLVVIDDCSTDNSVAVIRQWLSLHYPDAVFIAHETNVGICRTANEVLANAKGKYLRSLAADDRWTPNTLKRQVELMEQAPENTCVLYSDAILMDQCGKQLPGRFIEHHRQFSQAPEGKIFDVLVEGNFIPGMTALVRLRCVKDIGGYDEGLMTEDWDLWIRLSRRFAFIYYPEPTASYRILPTSMIRTLTPSIIESERRMFVKYLRLGWLKGKKEQEAIETEFLEACWAYSQGRRDSIREAAWALRHTMCIKGALLFMFVAARLPYRQFERLIAFLGKVKRRAKQIFNRDVDHMPH